MSIPTAAMLPERRLEGSLIGGTGPMKRMLAFAAVSSSICCRAVVFVFGCHALTVPPSTIFCTRGFLQKHKCYPKIETLPIEDVDVALQKLEVSAVLHCMCIGEYGHYSWHGLHLVFCAEKLGQVSHCAGRARLS